MQQIMPYEDFNETQTIQYGTAATSASANHAPLFIKNELNKLYNYTRMKFSESPLLWDIRKTYTIGEYVSFNNKVYVANADSKGQTPPGASWTLFNTAALDLELKYVQIHTDKYINLLTRNSHKMMRANEDSTNAIMTPKNGLVPWDNGVSSFLGTSTLKFNYVYSVNGKFTNINSGDIKTTTGTIGTLNSGTITASSKITSKEMKVSNNLITKTLEATNITASSKVTSNVIDVNSGTTLTNLSSTSGNINTLTSTSGTINTLNSGNITVQHKLTTSDIQASNIVSSSVKSTNIVNSNNISTKTLSVTQSANIPTLHSTTITADNFIGLSSSAKYADIAEKYSTDVVYEPGTILGFGGDLELTIYNKNLKLAGVVSTKPGYMLNSEAYGQYIALKGRVPCKIIGNAVKGQYIIASNDGFGEAVNDYTFEQSKILLGIAISDSKNSIVEIKV